MLSLERGDRCWVLGDGGHKRIDLRRKNGKRVLRSTSVPSPLQVRFKSVPYIGDIRASGGNQRKERIARGAPSSGTDEQRPAIASL